MDFQFALVKVVSLVGDLDILQTKAYGLMSGIAKLKDKPDEQHRADKQRQEFELIAVTGQIREMERALLELEQEIVARAEIKSVSENPTKHTAQVVLRFPLDNGKSLSFTRHLRRTGNTYSGYSVVTHTMIPYPSRWK